MKWITWQIMPWYRQLIRYGVYASIGIIVCCLVWRYGLSDRVVTSLSVVVDPQLSYQTHCALQRRIEDTFFMHAYQPVSDLIIPHFPCVDTLSYTRKLRTHSCIRCKAHAPCALINNSSVITSNGLSVARHFYRPDLVERLPVITLASLPPSDTHLNDIARWVPSIPDALKKQATFLWKDPTEIHMFFNKYPHHPVLITANTHLSKTYTDTFMHIIDSEDLIRIDARFNGMVIGTLARNKQSYKRGRRRV